MTLDHPLSNAPCKVIHYITNADKEFGPFFVYNSVDGIIRMGEWDFLNLVLKAHEYNIAVVKVTPTEFTSKNPLAEADMDTILRTCTSETTKYMSDKVRAAFRTIWAAKTGEVISL